MLKKEAENQIRELSKGEINIETEFERILRECERKLAEPKYVPIFPSFGEFWPRLGPAYVNPQPFYHDWNVITTPAISKPAVICSKDLKVTLGSGIATVAGSSFPVTGIDITYTN